MVQEAFDEVNSGRLQAVAKLYASEDTIEGRRLLLKSATQYGRAVNLPTASCKTNEAAGRGLPRRSLVCRRGVAQFPWLGSRDQH